MDEEDCFIDYEKRSHLDENQLEYRLFFPEILLKEDNIDEFNDQLSSYLDELSLNYIWNNEKFVLNKLKLVESEKIYESEGIIDYSDNIDDEWFIVHLLFQLTKKFKVIAQVHDSDGDFLLIYLADNLPKWASNSIHMKNRVFVCNGELHLIPPATNPSQITYLPAHGAIKSSYEAVRIVSDFPHISRASDLLQSSLKKRLELFKNYEKFYLHQTTCTIPATLAWLLSKQGGNANFMLSRAINRFCDKDPSDLKMCRTLNTFRADNMVDYRVTFTKFLYCKLRYCDFNADKRHNWPKPSDFNSSLAKDRLQLGLKLTCAFELLARLEDTNVDLKNDKNFQAYIVNLETLGYFKGLLKGSKDYKKLFDSAAASYSQQQQQNGSNQVKTLLASMPVDYLQKLNEEIDLVQKQQTDDNDDWLHVDQTQLDDYLEMYSSGNVSSTYDFKLISDAFKKFLDFKKPLASAATDDNVDFKSINKDDAELVDFNVNLIESSLNELLCLSKKNDEEESDAESDSFYEVNKNELSGDDDDDDENKNLKEYIKAMDNELEHEKDLAHLKSYGGDEATGDDNDDDEERLLNLDVNLVSNALESYSSQLGLTGPVSNILKSLGI